MATQQEVSNTLLAASLKVANLVNTNGVILSSGGLTVEWGYINVIQRAINCVQRQYNLGDYVSAPFIIAYNRLLNFVGIDTAGNINPNAQGGGTVINTINTGDTINTIQIPFTNQTSVTLANYVSSYSALYGKTPLVCQLYVDNGSNPASPDFGTAPQINFVVSGDPTSGYADVLWDFGLPTTGYILLSGVMGS